MIELEGKKAPSFTLKGSDRKNHNLMTLKVKI